jgi:uncharacterized protein (DUF1778 family)
MPRTKPLKPRAAGPDTRRVEVIATVDERIAWRTAAAAADTSLSEWMRKACNEAAQENAR